MPPYTSDSSASTDAQTPRQQTEQRLSLNRFPLPNPTANSTAENKQAAGADGNFAGSTHATSYSAGRVPASNPGLLPGLNSGSAQSDIATGPPPVPAFASTRRPIRATRNPNPYYVDSIVLDTTAWAATQEELNHINKSISFRNHG